MVALHEVWQLISGKMRQQRDLGGRGELISMIQGACLFHTFLGAQQSSRVTASDASGTGGAVGACRHLTDQGQSPNNRGRPYPGEGPGAFAFQWNRRGFQDL